MNVDPCRNARPYISDKIDGEPLPLLVRFHLRICPPCRRVHRSLEATREALRALRDVDPESLGPGEADEARR
jgi:predicted anti-sigma-YlaC factor YlaD